MRVKPSCAACLLSRAVKEIERATQDPRLRMEAVRQVLELLAREFSGDKTPAELGTMRDRLIKEVTGNPDPYREVKAFSNSKAFSILPILKEELDSLDEEEAFVRACYYSVGGNRLDFDLPMHEPRAENLLEELRRTRMSVDESRELMRILKGKDVLFLADNAGEIVIDRLLVERIHELCDRLTVATRGGPILNDATLEDAKRAGLGEYAELVTTGVDAFGVPLNECSEEFLRVFKRCEVIVAKGMANYESLSEYRLGKPVAHLMFVKCWPIGEDVGAPKDTGVVVVRGAKGP